MSRCSYALSSPLVPPAAVILDAPDIARHPFGVPTICNTTRSPPRGFSPVPHRRLSRSDVPPFDEYRSQPDPRACGRERTAGSVTTLWWQLWDQDMSHEDDEVQHGDYNIGMNVAPGPYLSDSDLSVTSIELSPAQVLWEKKLLDDTSILRNCLLKRGRRQATAAQEATRIKLQGLRRRATELCFGHQQRTKSIGGRKILSRPLSVTEMGIDDSGLRSRQSSLDVGDDCTTIARPSLDFTDEDITRERDRSSQNSGDSGCDHREPEDADLTT